MVAMNLRLTFGGLNFRKWSGVGGKCKTKTNKKVQCSAAQHSTGQFSTAQQLFNIVLGLEDHFYMISNIRMNTCPVKYTIFISIILSTITMVDIYIWLHNTLLQK